MYSYKVEYLNPRNVLLDRFIFCFHNEDTLRFTYHPLNGPFIPILRFYDVNSQAEFREISNIFIFKSKSSFFQGKNNNDNKGEFLDLHGFILYMIFVLFLESGYGYFRENFEKSYLGCICENPGISPSYRFRDFPSKINNLSLELKTFKFLGIRLINSFLVS